MDIKDAFNHISKAQLITQIIELVIDGDFVTWTSSFLTKQKVQLIINRRENKEKEIETRIPQSSLVLPILFLIYISKVFDKVTEASLSVISLSFIDNLRFIASGISVKDAVKTLEKVAKTVSEWEMLNTMTYNTSKIEAVFFSKSHQQWLNKQLREAKIKVKNERIIFNKEATRWLRIWLDSQLKFISYINKKMRKTCAAKVQIKGLMQIYGLVPGLV